MQPSRPPTDTARDLELEDLRDLIELCELGGKVLWPSGLDLRTARALLAQRLAAPEQPACADPEAPFLLTRVPRTSNPNRCSYDTLPTSSLVAWIALCLHGGSHVAPPERPSMIWKNFKFR